MMDTLMVALEAGKERGSKFSRSITMEALDSRSFANRQSFSLQSLGSPNGVFWVGPKSLC